MSQEELVLRIKGYFKNEGGSSAEIWRALNLGFTDQMGRHVFVKSRPFDFNPPTIMYEVANNRPVLVGLMNEAHNRLSGLHAWVVSDVETSFNSVTGLHEIIRYGVYNPWPMSPAFEWISATDFEARFKVGFQIWVEVY